MNEDDIRHELVPIVLLDETIAPIPGVSLNYKERYDTIKYKGEEIVNSYLTTEANSRIFKSRKNEILFNKLTPCGLRVFLYIVCNLKYNSNVITLNPKIISMEIEYKERAIYNSINELLKEKVIFKINRDRFAVNPCNILCANPTDFKRMYDINSSKYIAEFDENKPEVINYKTYR